MEESGEFGFSRYQSLLSQRERLCQAGRLASASKAILVMGVAGSGKTTVGLRLAAALGYEFRDGDDYHSPASIEKMRRGEPLNDEDRMPWLARLRCVIESALAEGTGIVLACSALRASYRDLLLPHNGSLTTMYLQVGRDMARQRIEARASHFMPAGLIDSQFAALEEPENAVIVNANQPEDEVVAEAIGAIYTMRHAGFTSSQPTPPDRRRDRAPGRSE
jgi:gluconokinase